MNTIGDASVPFEFDIHALIENENAPALEHKIHKRFLAMPVNTIGSRKKFFRLTLLAIHQEIDKLKQGDDFTIKTRTEKAVATEYRDTLETEDDPEKKTKWLALQTALADRQLKIDTLRFSFPDAPETEAGDKGT